MTDLEVRHLDIYSSQITPRANYRAGLYHYYSPLRIIRQLNDAANLCAAHARRYSQKHDRRTAEEYKRAERSFRRAQKYASERYAETR